MIRIALVLAALAISTPAFAIGATYIPEGCKVSPAFWGWMSRIDCSERPLPPGCQRLPYNHGLDYLFGSYVSCAPREKGAR